MFSSCRTFLLSLAILCPSIGLAQDRMEIAIDGNINVFHSGFIAGGFTQGLMGGEQHPSELRRHYEEFRRSVETGREDVSATLQSLGVNIDSLISQCGGTKMYSSCTSTRCRQKARGQLSSCIDRDTLKPMNEEVARVEDLHEKLNSDQVELSFALKEDAVQIRALGVEMRINTTIPGQSLMAVACSPLDSEIPAQEKVRMQLACMKRAWGVTYSRLGCEPGSSIDPKYASMEKTENFQHTICALSLKGMENGFINTDDFIHVFEPNADWDQYTEAAN